MNEVDRRIGVVALVGFISCIFAANYMVQHVGTRAYPGGPHTVTLLGLTAPSGVLIVGLSFTLRDLAQMALGKWCILLAVVVGAALSYFVAPSLAWASAVAFLFGEGCDWAVYTPLSDRGHWWAGIVASNTVGSAVDSLLFLWIAFSSLDFFWGQFWLKLLVTVPAILVLAPWRIRRAVLARHQRNELVVDDGCRPDCIAPYATQETEAFPPSDV